MHPLHPADTCERYQEKMAVHHQGIPTHRVKTTELEPTFSDGMRCCRIWPTSVEFFIHYCLFWIFDCFRTIQESTDCKGYKLTRLGRGEVKLSRVAGSPHLFVQSLCQISFEGSLNSQKIYTSTILLVSKVLLGSKSWSSTAANQCS